MALKVFVAVDVLWSKSFSLLHWEVPSARGERTRGFPNNILVMCSYSNTLPRSSCFPMLPLLKTLNQKTDKRWNGSTSLLISTESPRCAFRRHENYEIYALAGMAKNEDYEWTYTEEPHATPRTLILKDHPEVFSFVMDVLTWWCQIKNLFGPHPASKFFCGATVLLQILLSVRAIS